ncbi:hypothetical protein CLOM_g18030 [Closterium sp. NIES-68]|nr:hypothetical protein CLOM_g18030 [Closterium sp. NIES-68]GJP64570.1 hypothetical protein CLOP_g21548 [Closterium sp. NIES-67]
MAALRFVSVLTLSLTYLPSLHTIASSRKFGRGISSQKSKVPKPTRNCPTGLFCNGSGTQTLGQFRDQRKDRLALVGRDSQGTFAGQVHARRGIAGGHL